MAYLKTKALVLVKIESNYATDSLPTGASAILCEDPDIQPIAKSLERNNVKPVFGTKDKLIIGEGLKLSFTTEMRGTGVSPVTTAPDIGVLFRMAGFTQTIVATSGQECCKYTPHSNFESGESGTVYFYRDGNLHKLLGGRATFSLDAKANDYPKLKWEITGLYAGPVTGTMPAPTFSAVAPMVFKSAAFALDSFAATIESLKIDVKNNVIKRPDANAATGIKSYNISDRSITGEVDPEVETIATKDFWAMWANSTTAAMTATIGQTAGNKCLITCPGVQIDDLKYGDREQILTYQLPLLIKPTATGNDDIEFKFN